MICTPPYNGWPLHVKIFTEEAAKAWETAGILAPPLPRGFTCTIELEGVDGKSGLRGSGRVGPIDVTDGRIFPKSLAAYLVCSTWLF
jgi:structure-specific endonuclease subunit SLX1